MAHYLQPVDGALFTSVGRNDRTAQKEFINMLVLYVIFKHLLN